MKENNEKQKAQQQKQGTPRNARGKTQVPGQNPKANDDPSHDEHNDQNRRP